jgi:hypothetical protein
MTTTKREQILAHIDTTLAATSGVSGRVYRSRQEAFSRSESPSVIVEPGPESSGPEAVSTCKIDHTLTLVVAVYARGLIPDQVADPVVQSVHSLLMADRSLGGLAMDIWPLSRNPEFNAADGAAVVEVLSYRIRYRTSVTDLSVGAP